MDDQLLSHLELVEGGHYIDDNNGTQLDFKADLEVDFEFAFNPGGGPYWVYFDAAKWTSPTTYAVNYQGSCNQSGTPAQNSNEDGTVFAQNSITFAFNNSGSDNIGLEIAIPFSQLGPNVTSANGIQIFAFVVSADAYFSNVTVPGNIAGNNPGYNVNFNALSGEPYHAPEAGGDYPLPAQFVSLAAITGDSKITLVWGTGNEFNNEGFEIFRRAEGEEEFVLIASYLTNPELKGLRTGPHGKRYKYVDAQVKNGRSYEYKIYSVDIYGNRTEFGSIVAKPVAEIPDKFVLYQNYPNPFNPTTEIRFDIPESGYVKLEIFNSLGEHVAVLYDSFMDAGSKSVKWNAVGFASGVYFYRLTADNFVDVKKMVLMK